MDLKRFQLNRNLLKLSLIQLHINLTSYIEMSKIFFFSRGKKNCHAFVFVLWMYVSINKEKLFIQFVSNPKYQAKKALHYLVFMPSSRDSSIKTKQVSPLLLSLGHLSSFRGTGVRRYDEISTIHNSLTNHRTADRSNGI